MREIRQIAVEVAQRIPPGNDLRERLNPGPDATTPDIRAVIRAIRSAAAAFPNAVPGLGFDDFYTDVLNCLSDAADSKMLSRARAIAIIHGEDIVARMIRDPTGGDVNAIDDARASIRWLCDVR
jgi:hypothetical protein